jgi:F-type H+-transporting ATPase subunit g
MSRQEWREFGIITAQVIGFFSVGEMIGRMKLIGYRGDTAGHH